MEAKEFIIVLTGARLSGKTLIANKICRIGETANLAGVNFTPRIVRDCPVKRLVLEKGKADIEKNDIYQPDLAVDILKKCLDEKISPIIVVNNISILKELQIIFHGQVLSLFILRDNTSAAYKNVYGNSDILAIHKDMYDMRDLYINNLLTFDYLLLNNKEYEPEDVRDGNMPSINAQVHNLCWSILKNKLTLRDVINDNSPI